MYSAGNKNPQYAKKINIVAVPLKLVTIQKYYKQAIFDYVTELSNKNHNRMNGK